MAPSSTEVCAKWFTIWQGSSAAKCAGSMGVRVAAQTGQTEEKPAARAESRRTVSREKEISAEDACTTLVPKAMYVRKKTRQSFVYKNYLRFDLTAVSEGGTLSSTGDTRYLVEIEVIPNSNLSAEYVANSVVMKIKQLEGMCGSCLPQNEFESPPKF